MSGAELGPAVKSLAATLPIVVPRDFILAGLLGGSGRIGNNLLIISNSEGSGVHFPVSLLYICDDEPCTIPYLEGVAITVPFAVVLILNDPFVGGRGIILTHLDELIMVCIYIYV